MQIHKNIFSDGQWQDELPEIEGIPILAFVFSAPEFKNNPKPFDDLMAKYADLEIVGCSTSGEILEAEISDNSTVVALTTFEKSDFQTASVKIQDHSNSIEAGKRLAEQLDSPNLVAVSVISDGLNVNGTELAQGLNNNFRNKVVVSGGLAADGENFNDTWVLIDGKPQSGYVSAVGFYGDNIEVKFGSEGGWQPFGPERVVTKSDNNILYELDGRPALELYKEYLGDRASGLPATALLFPLQVNTDDQPLVRTILSIDESSQSMTFAGDIPEQSKAQLMRANHDSLIDGAEQAAEQIENPETATHKNESLCIAVSCVGRRLVLGENCEEEIEATKEALSNSTTQIGFYSYGELAPTGYQPCGLHNQTMTLTQITER